MAKTVSDEKIKLSLVIDGNPAQQELYKLEKATSDLNKRQKELGDEKRKLIREGKIESDRYRELTAEIKQNSAAIKANKERMSELQKEIGLTGLTMGQLQQKATALRAALRNAVPGGEAYQRYNAELTQVNGRLDELRGRGQAAGNSIGQLADKFNRYAGLAASAVAVGTGVVLSLQKMIDYNGKLADAQSNVQKTTGMTKQEVDELTKSFGMFQTRTSRIDLLGIAETGGRLGIAKEDINDFVKVMDKAAVALGDSFEGGPEMVAEKLGRIKGLFKETKDIGVEGAFESIGSALNDLGAAGTASEGNVSEFVTRLGAMLEAFKPTIAQALGLGAAFEESGIRAEVAASNYSKVIGIAANNIAGFAQVMGKPKKAIEDLINTNPNEFFLQFAHSIKNLKGTKLANVLDALKLNDNEVKQVLGAAGKDVEMFREKIELAGESMADATSLTNEFDLKNNNLGATLEKLQKKIIGMFSSETIVNWLGSAAEWFAKLIGATEDTDGKMQAWRNTLGFVAKMIAVVVAALISSAGAQKLAVLWTTRNTEATLLYNIQQRASAILTGIQTVASNAGALAMALKARNITQAKEALKAMSLAMKTTPWGLLLGMIAAAVTAYAVFSNEATKVNEGMKLSVDLKNKVTEATSKQKQSVSDLVAVVKDENATNEQKERALKQLKKITDGYLETLTLENIATKEGERLINRYIKAIDKLAEAKAIVEIKTKLKTQELESDNKILALSLEKKGTKKEGSAFWGGADGKFLGLGGRNKMEIDSEIEDEKENRKRTQLQQKAIEQRRNSEIKLLREDIAKREAEMKKLKVGSAKYKELAQDVATDRRALDTLLGLSSTPSSTEDAPDDVSVPGTGKKEKYDDSYLKDEQSASDALYQIWKKNQESRIALMEDGYEKELAIENLKTSEILRENYKRHDALIAIENQIQKDIEAAEKSGDTKKVESLKRQQEIYKKERIELSKDIEHQESLHQLRVGTIQEKAGREETEKLREKYETEKNIRETAFLDELASLNITEEEKAKRKEAFAKEEAKKEMELLESLISDYEKMINDVDFNGIDFSMLSPEDKEKLQADIEVLRLALAKLKETQKGGAAEKKKPDDLGLGNTTDILGYSAEDWYNTFTNLDTLEGKLRGMQMAVGAMQQLWTQLDQFQTASENAQLKKYERNSDARKKKLKQQLDAGYINQSQYKKQVEQIDQELDKKKAEIEYKQAKRQRLMAIANVVMNTAQAIIGIWAQFPKFDFGATAAIMSGVVGALGALQLATILKTPLPAKGFEQGLYNQDVMREQDGKIFNAAYGGKTRSGVVNKPTFFLTGENGPEMIIDSRAYSQLSPETRNALLREIRGIKGYENGYYKNGVLHTGESSSSDQPTPTPSDDALMRMILNVLSENTEVMKDIRDSGIMAIVSPKDMKSMKALREGLKKYEELKNKAKQG